MKVTYCDFCGAKLKQDDETSTVEFKLSMRFGGIPKQRIFEGCTACVDEVHKMVIKVAIEMSKKK